MMRGLSCLSLAGALALAVVPVAGMAQSPKATPDDAARTHDQASLAFERDLVSVLAPQADPLPLLAAAILARPLAGQPKANSFHSLIERAAQADGNDPAISWTRLADCDAKADACPNTAALALLQTQAPDNAAVWLLKFGQDTRDQKQDDARADLAKAAAASAYDDYAGTSMKALAGSVGVLPPPADTYEANGGGNAAAVQMTLVFGLASAQPQPALPVVAKLCDSAAGDASIKADCVKLGKTLEWGSSPLARSLGLHLRETLNDDPAQQQSAHQARVNLVWQVQNFNQLIARAQVDKAIAQHLLALARNGGTEMSLILAALRTYQIPLEAPADWKPPQAHAPAG